MNLDSIKKLQQKKYRSELGYCLVEGEHLVLELQNAAVHQPGLKVAELYLTDHYAEWQSDLAMHTVSSKQMSLISATKSPQGIVAVLPMAAIQPPVAEREIAIYLHEIQDPGNLGTILRTLAWFGGYRCLLSPGSVDPFNPKVIRASMGAIFHVPLELDVSLDSLQGRFQQIGCLDMNGEPLNTDAFKACDCYLFGNEARGVPRDQLDRLQAHAFTIPGAGLIESLNLGTAVSLSVYERQR
ncbi:TrmH family RNA methyltransferase [Marinobacterium halophilum]|uniref:TrmH family RNA methyltransferase n=1 Tax=Marinobacterium halophilum TaxID=267374 RepID=A0A2P8F530_9GAMM|nr:RNA methyltransferase [Marinobacterium halophilum]PSL16825.1 TrmH family RNA methyltransferase [Marinobacterium halophilum]